MAIPTPALPLAGSMLQQVLGRSDFATLGAAVQRFHTLPGAHTLHGQVDIAAPASLPARWMARCLGAPHRAANGPLRFDLRAAPDAETWTRHFPGPSGCTMRSRMHREGDRVIETLGPARLRFAIDVAGGTLSMRLERLQFLGIPCPRWLAPRLSATEHGDGDRLHFDVRATVPVIGLVAHYRGYVQLLPEGAA